MTTVNQREVSHDIIVNAPSDEIYRLIAEVDNWPQIFPPTVHVGHLERSADSERIRIWATANGQPKSWVSRRVLRPDALSIDFRQEVSTPPVAAMGGTWTVEPVSAVASRVRLLHDYRAVDDDPDSLAWIDQAVDKNSRAELAALKTTVEQAVGDTAGWTFSFEDSVWIGAAAEHVYDFLNEARSWHDRLPHVTRVQLDEDDPGLQVLEMDTVAKDGSVHTTKSVRVCFPHREIVYKQITVPALMTLHTGRWSLTPAGDGFTATSQHTVTINPDTIETVLGADAGLSQAKDYVQTALSANSRVTLELAKTYAESLALDGHQRHHRGGRAGRSHAGGRTATGRRAGGRPGKARRPDHRVACLDRSRTHHGTPGPARIA